MLSGPSSKKIYLYTVLTLGLYFFYWCSKSKYDINNSAKQKLIPTTWLLALPGGNYWWMWKYSEALEIVSYERLKKSDTFLYYILGSHAWLLLTFGITPNFSFGGRTHLSSTLITIILIYIFVSIILEILGSAFFCTTMQKKISLIARPPNLKPSV
jgi:hypothetical protein